MADIEEEVTAETSPAQEPVVEEQQGQQQSTTTSVSDENDDPAKGAIILNRDTFSSLL